MARGRRRRLTGGEDGLVEPDLVDDLADAVLDAEALEELEPFCEEGPEEGAAVEGGARGAEELGRGRSAGPHVGACACASAREGGGTHVVLGALLFEGLLGEDVADAEHDGGGCALGEHGPPDEGRAVGWRVSESAVAR